MHTRTCAVLLALLLLATGCGGATKSGKGAQGAQGDPGSSSPSSDGGDAPAADPGAGVAKVGQCFSMTGRQSRASVAPPAKVSCQKPHTSVIAYVGYVATPLTAATPVAQRRAAAKKVCEPAFRQVVGGTLADRAQSVLTWTFFTPGQTQLKKGARWVRCDVLARSGSQLVTLPSATPLLGNGVPDSLRICGDKAGNDVSCARPHAYRVTAVFRAPGTTYPGTTTVEARSRCQTLTGVLGGFVQVPSQEGWDSGDRFVRCLASTLTPTASPSP